MSSQEVLLKLAKEQDRHEEDYSRDIVARISLFLVFAGFVSAISIHLIDFLFDDKGPLLWGWTCGAIFLALTISVLFVSLFFLLKAALMPGYSRPAPVNEFQQHYDSLLKHHDGDEDEAVKDLRTDLLDAYIEAVPKNFENNQKRMRFVLWAHKLMLVALILLLTSLSFLVIPKIISLELQHYDNSQKVILENTCLEMGNDQEIKEECKKEGKKKIKEKSSEERAPTTTPE